MFRSHRDLDEGFRGPVEPCVSWSSMMAGKHGSNVRVKAETGTMMLPCDIEQRPASIAAVQSSWEEAQILRPFSAESPPSSVSDAC